jgi:hypothetical protein
MPLPVVDEVKSNYEYDKMFSFLKEKQNQYMNFEGDVANNKTTTNVNSDWKSMLPLIAVTSLVTFSLVVILKGTR